MTVTLTATPVSPPTTLNVPAPGEGVNSAGVQAYVQSIINSIESLVSRLPGVNRSSGLLDLMLPPQCAICSTSVPGTTCLTTDWLPLCGINSRAGWFHQSLNGGDAVRFPLAQCLTQGMVIHAFIVDFLAGGSHSGLPSIKPVVKLTKTARNTGGSVPAQTVIDSQSDPSASTAAYQLIHPIGKTLGAPETVDLSAWCYELIVIGEGGTNSLVGSTLLDARVSVAGG